MQSRQNSEKPFLLFSSQRGFTLLEVLIAVMIFGISVTVILQQFSVALRSGSKTQEIVKAVIHAKEKLEELKTKKEFSESTESGSFEDGFEWETRVIPYSYGEDNDEFFENLKYETFSLETIITWQVAERQRHTRLSTLKTVRKKKWN